MTHLTQIKPGGRQHPLLTLSDTERSHLEDLYSDSGAWTVNEALHLLGESRLREFLDHHLLTITNTPMGPLIVMLAQGRIATYGASSGAHSLDRHLNQAYLRLCLDALNWTLIPPDQSRIGIDTFAHGRQVHEVMTENGPVLVAARMTGDGYSLTQIHKLTRALKSTALARDFHLVILTPNRRRGQVYTKDKGDFLQVRHLIPEIQAPLIYLPHFTERPQALTPPGPHLAGEAWRSDPRYLQLPDHLVTLLQLPRDDRINGALAAIERDGVMSAGMLQRAYALTPDDLPNVLQQTLLTRTTPSKLSSEAHVTFLTLSRKLSRQDVGRLAHRCGTGHLRHLLDVPGDHPGWVAEARSKRRLEEPDAVYIDATGARWAIEFDAGSYHHDTIDTKLDTFKDRGFAGTIWGSSTARRQRLIDTRYGARLAQPTLLVEWWS